MDRPTWIVLMEASRLAARRLGAPRRRPVYSDLLVLRMWLWATYHDRPLCWACHRESYNGMYRPRRLLSVSRFSRRLRSRRFLRLRALLHGVLTEGRAGAGRSSIDGKALAIGECTTDPDARDGVVTTGRFRKGYKLHARANTDAFIEEYRVTPLNEGEAKVARRLLKRVRPGSLVLADGNYDSRGVYGAVERRGAWLFTPIKGHATSPSTFQRMPESRRQAIRVWRRQPGLAERAMNVRQSVERTFAHLCGFGGGLGPLPAWARRLHRVRLWVDAKIAIYHARLVARIALNMKA